MKGQPSRFGLRLLRAICPEHLHEEIEGDLIQKFERDVTKSGERSARRKFVWNAIRFFRPGIILRNRFYIELNQLDMLLNHLKFAIRFFLKDKFFSALNVLGLSLGIGVSIILLLILQNDLTYDQYHLNHKKIYRVGCHLQQTGFDFKWARSAMDLGTVLQDEIPEIEKIVRIDDSWGRQLVRYENGNEKKEFYESNIIDADSTYFQVFTHKFISGDISTCLLDVNSAVLTKSTSDRYFGAGDPIGKSLIITGESWTVKAVIEDLPENSHLKFDLLLSNQQFIRKKSEIESESFWNPGVYLYIMVPEDYKPSDFYAKFPPIFDTYFKPFGVEVNGKYEPILEPLTRIHFYSDLDFDEFRGNINYLYGFTITGIFIVLLACINYMNLSTAKSINRATEISIKKLVGSRRRVLVFSFLAESILLSLISLVIAMMLVYTVLHFTSFNQLIDKKLTFDLLKDPVLLIGSLGITFLIGLLSGLYPAFYLPSIPMLQALKGAFKSRRSDQFFRKALITIQFSISIFVVVCTMFMRSQIDFIRSKELGFEKENIIVLPIRDTLVERQINGIKNEMVRHPHIVSATNAYNFPGNLINIKNYWVESEEGMKQMGFMNFFVGEDYVKTMGMEIIRGTDFQAGRVPKEETSYLVNETAAKMIGQGKDVIGRKMKFFHGEIPGHVVGVVKDFNFKSLHNSVEPVLIIKQNDQGGFLHLKVDGQDLPGTIEFIKSKWMTYDPNHPFEYFFLDQRFDEQYRADEIQNKLLSVLSYICIFISLLGIVGLSAFTATQRVKEIGIRKVLGASIPEIILMLSKDILLLVIISALIIAPFSNFIVVQWMENFAYQTQLNYLLYVVVTLVALGFVFVTVLCQSIRTARANPVDTLKSE